MTALYHYSTEAEIVRIGEEFLARTLPKPEWTHGAHWAAAFWVILRRPDLVAERDMRDLIRRYNETTGVANTDDGGYHETITQASLIVARRFIAEESEGAALHALCNSLFASPFGRSEWLLSYWTKATLFSVKARREWVAPDVRPLGAAVTASGSP